MTFLKTYATFWGGVEEAWVFFRRSKLIALKGAAPLIFSALMCFYPTTLRLLDFIQFQYIVTYS